MYIKKYLVIIFERLVLHLKCLGIWFYIPLLVLNVFLPILNYLSYVKYGIGDQLLMNIGENSLLFIPIFSSWWIIFGLVDYVDSDGNEVLYTNCYKNKLPDAFLLFLIYFLNVFVLFVFYYFLFKSIWVHFAVVLFVSIFYFGIAYSSLFLTGTLTLSILGALLILVVNIFAKVDNVFFPIYYTKIINLSSTQLIRYIPFFIVGFILIIMGVLLNKKRCKLN